MATHHRSLHALLGGGEVADVLLWRRRNVSAAAVVGATVVWFLFERAGYSFLSVMSNALLLLVAILFFWSKSFSMLNRPVLLASVCFIVYRGISLRQRQLDAPSSLLVFEENILKSTFCIGPVLSIGDSIDNYINRPGYILSDWSTQVLGGIISSLLLGLQHLQYVDLSCNRFNGSRIPDFLGSLHNLRHLDLSLSSFVGSIPPQLAWIGEKLPSLAFLVLRSNMFYGHIPVDLTKLGNLQYLDLAYNNISGSIPKYFVNCTGMTLPGDTSELVMNYGFASELYTENLTIITKGQERLYTTETIYMVNLDLSCNNLVGDIPEEIGTLVALKNLNLSWNAISGKIPEKIGALVQVESLDLSHNELSGEIPTCLSALTYLSRLNLSYNNVTGKISSGNQLQTLDHQASIYIGNPGLCSPPLSQNCSEAGLVPATPEDHEDGIFFFLALGTGYVIGLWVVFCVFLVKREWRIACFSFYDSSYDWVYVQVAVRWACLTRKNG